MEAIIEYIIHNWPTLAIVLIVGVTCFIISRKFTQWEDKHNKLHDELERRTCNADCQSHKEEIDALKQDLKEIKNDIITIKSLLIIKHKNAADLFSMKSSPRKLNENGEKLFSDINGAEFLNDNKEFFFSKIDEQMPKTALDVEMAANAVCSSNTDNDIFNPLKNFVYNSPTRILKNKDGEECRYDIALSDICFVLSLPLRDMYLKEHKEISQ